MLAKFHGSIKYRQCYVLVSAQIIDIQGSNFTDTSVYAWGGGGWEVGSSARERHALGGSEDNNESDVIKI